MRFRWLSILAVAALTFGFVVDLPHPPAASAVVPSISSFRLLGNTLGYDTRGTKQMLVRTVSGVDAGDVDLNASTWALKDSSGTTVAAGHPGDMVTTYGIQFWPIEFSEFATPGTYHMEVELKQDASTVIGSLSSLDFLIESQLLASNVLLPLTIDNADSRRAPASYGYGFFDCSASKMGEAYSHGIFLNGLLQTYNHVKSTISSTDRNRFVTNANVAFDYLVDRWTSNGQFEHQHASRPNGADEIFGGLNDVEATYGMASYLDLFKSVDPGRASTANYNKVVASYHWLASVGPAWNGLDYDVYKDYLIPIAVHLYHYSGDVFWKNEAITRLNTFLASFNLRTMGRNPFRAIPFFEGLKMAVDAFPTDPSYSTWITAARSIKDTYYASSKVLEENVFSIINTSAKATAAADWDNGTLTSDEWGDLVVNETASSYAIDAVILAELTGDARLERIAAGELGWVLGLNPGLPQSEVENPPTTRNSESASFISNGSTRRTRLVTGDWTPSNSSWMSIVNGFSTGFVYNHNFFNAENFIKHDGAFAYATVMYDKYLQSQPQPVAGSLTGAAAATPAAVDLTLAGAQDWVHWGRSTASDVDRKSGVWQQIGDFTKIGSASVSRYSNSSVSYSWSGGTPTATAAGSTTGVYIQGLGNGFRLSIPAGPSPTTVKLYVGAWKAAGTLTATLSDGSATPYSAVVSNAAGTSNSVVTLSFAAETAGQHLNIDYVLTTDFAGGNVTLQSAAVEGGMLALTSAPTAASVNLSSEGTTDWAHWGLSAASDFTSKSGAVQEISNLTKIGTALLQRYSNNDIGYSWTGGTPTASATGSTTGVYQHGLGSGFRLTAPAGTTPKTLKVYLGAWRAGGTLTARLSDGSAVPVSVQASNPTATVNTVVTLMFAARSAGQTITVDYTLTTDFGGGNVTLQGAALR